MIMMIMMIMLVQLLLIGGYLQILFTQHIICKRVELYS